jgi:hypothetical protein
VEGGGGGIVTQNLFHHRIKKSEKPKRPIIRHVCISRISSRAFPPMRRICAVVYFCNFGTETKRSIIQCLCHLT